MTVDSIQHVVSIRRTNHRIGNLESGTLNLEFCVAGVPPASPARRDGFKVLCSRFQVLHPPNLLTILPILIILLLIIDSRFQIPGSIS